MLEKIRTYILKKNIKKHIQNNTFPRKFVNYDAAKSILLLFESDYTEKNHEARRLIQQMQADGKRVMAWGFVDKKEIKTAILPDYRVLNQKDAGFLGKPTQSFLDEIESQEFDLMIDLTTTDFFPLIYIALYANVYCKCGVKKSFDSIYDFMIHLAVKNNEEMEDIEEINTTYVYNQIIFYLKSVQTRD